MSILATPVAVAVLSRAMQVLVGLVERRRSKEKRALLPEFQGTTSTMTVPTSIGPAPVVVYRSAPAPQERPPPVHVNFHGGGYILRLVGDDDPQCRFLAATAGVVVLNVDYAVAPQHSFPEPPHQAYEVVDWVAKHGAENGWDGSRLTIGGQSAGAGLAAAVARQALERGGPRIALQVLHYPPLDLVTPARDKRASIAKPMLRPWMTDIFDNAYVPDVGKRADRLVSPANALDTADLTGIAPALVITPEFDLLRAEGRRYAERLREVGALIEHIDVPQVDHGYDLEDVEKARGVYALIARHVKRATEATEATEGRGPTRSSS